MTTSMLNKFHTDSADENDDILKHFNILFYGYGCKKKILTTMFPKAIIINCLFLKTDDFIALLKDQLRKTLNSKLRQNIQIKDIYKFMNACDCFLQKNNVFVTLVVLNFRFEFIFLQELQNIQLVATIENVYTTYSKDDIYDFNFIFRDLTTFLPYEKEIVDINLQSNLLCARNVIEIFNCVSKRSKNICLAILKNFKVQQKISYKDLLEKVAKKFLVSKINLLNDLLSEFYDHRVLKNGNNEILINLSESTVKNVIKHFSK